LQKNPTLSGKYGRKEAVTPNPSIYMCETKKEALKQCREDRVNSMHRYESTDWYHGCWLISTKPKQASFNTKKQKEKLNVWHEGIS
jgi:hypothetical protein